MVINCLEQMEKLIAQKKFFITKNLASFFPNSLILQDYFPLNESFFLETGKYLSKNVQYFSMNQLIKYSLYKTNFNQSYLGQCKLNNITLFDFPSSGFEFDFKPEPINKKTDLFLDFVDKPAFFFKKANQNLYNSLLAAKICSSSFFLFEWFEIYGKMHFISENTFFSCWEKWEKWKQDLGIECNLKKGSFEEVFQNFYKPEEVKINFIPINPSCFYPMAIGNSDGIRSLVVYNDILDITQSSNFPRKLELDLIN